MLGSRPIGSSPLSSQLMLMNGRVANWTLAEKSANGLTLTAQPKNLFTLDDDGLNALDLDASGNSIEITV